jgi:hypothetical protein
MHYASFHTAASLGCAPVKSMLAMKELSCQQHPHDIGIRIVAAVDADSPISLRGIDAVFFMFFRCAVAILSIPNGVHNAPA